MRWNGLVGRLIYIDCLTTEEGLVAFEVMGRAYLLAETTACTAKRRPTGEVLSIPLPGTLRTLVVCRSGPIVPQVHLYSGLAEGCVTVVRVRNDTPMSLKTAKHDWHNCRRYLGRSDDDKMWWDAKPEAKSLGRCDQVNQSVTKGK